MTVLISYQVPIKQTSPEGEVHTQISGHGYFGIPEFTQRALQMAEVRIKEMIEAQLADTGMEVTSPLVLTSVVRLDDPVEESRIIH